MARAKGSAQIPQTTEQDLFARDTYRSHAILAVLIVLWIGVLTRYGLPFPTWFFTVRLALAFFAVVALAYLVWTWRRPRLRVALVFLLVELVGVAILITVSARLAADLGARWEPIAALQLVIAAIPLIAPPFLWMGYVLLGGFAAQLVLIELFQRQAGLGPLVGAEPFGSLCVALVALAVLVLRRERQQVGLAYIHSQSEAATLSRLAPVLSAIRDELDRAIRALEVVESQTAMTPEAFPRSILRLDTLRDQLDAFEVPAASELHEDERQLLAHDSQHGALIFAVVGIAVLLFAAWSSRALPVGYSTQLALYIAAGYGVLVVWLWRTRARPTVRRGVLASILLLAAAEVLAMYMHSYWVQLGDRVFPFIGEKLIMMILVVLRFPRLWIGVMLLALVVITHIAIEAIFATQPIPLEPWHMMVFAVIGLGFLIMGEQRRIASIALLRAETIQSSLHRRANLSLTLCDQLNTPLQTLVGIIEMLPPSASTRDALSQIERLRSCDELTKVVEEIPPDLRRAALNGAGHLERRA